jgi:release factor glutamine methyltransferase
MLVSEALITAKNLLKKQGINSYQIDALLLLCHSANLTKEQIIFNPNLNLTKSQSEQFFDLVQRRCNKEPISQIIGKREFFGNDFLVTKNVLDPRPDSETLIEEVLEYFPNRNVNIDILELGVGFWMFNIDDFKAF